MKCPICEKDVELQKKQVGVDEQGAPIFHQYAICRDCKKQWDLDKQRARKAGSIQKASSSSVTKQETGDKAVAAKLSQEQKAARKPIQKPDSELYVEGKDKKKATASPTSARKVKQEDISAEVSSDRKLSKKPVHAELSSEGRPNRKSVSAETSSEGKTNRKPVSTEMSVEKKANKKATPAEASTEGKSNKKPGSSESTSEKKMNKKPVPAETSPEGKTIKKSSSSEAIAERKTSRKSTSQGSASVRENSGKPAAASAPSKGAASGGTSPAKVTSGKPSAEGSSGRKQASEQAAVKREQSASGNRDKAATASVQPKRPPVKKGSSSSGEQRYGNIPPDKVRAKKEHAVRKGYEDMLSTDPNYKPPKKKKSISEKDNMSSVKSERPVSVKQRPHTKVELEDDYVEDEEMEYEEVAGRFRIPRIIFGIISVVAAGFFAYGGFFKGLDNIAAGSTASTGTTYIVYGICMLVSGLLLIILQNNNSIFAFLVPMMAYFVGAAFSFLNRQDEQILLYCAIAGTVMGIILLILAIVSRNSGYEDSDDYDDSFDDEY